MKILIILTTYTKDSCEIKGEKKKGIKTVVLQLPWKYWLSLISTSVLPKLKPPSRCLNGLASC